MEFRRIKLGAKDHNLVILGDMHVGSANCAEDRIREDVERIASSENTSAIIIGDFIEAINPSDPRFDLGSVKQTYNSKQIERLSQEQVHDAAELLRPISDKIDGVLYGNHEDYVLRKYHFDPVDALVRELGLPEDKNWNYGAIARYEFSCGTTRKYCPTVFATHGTGSSTAKESALKKCKSLRSVAVADVFAIGHHHKRICDTESVLRPVWSGKNGRMDSSRLGFLCTGAYMRTYLEGYAGYGERRNYSPVEIGSVVVSFKPGVRDFSVHNY